MKNITLGNEMSWETSINDRKIYPCLGNNIMESIWKYLKNSFVMEECVILTQKNMHTLDKEEIWETNNLSTKKGGLNKSTKCIHKYRHDICSNVGG